MLNSLEKRTEAVVLKSFFAMAKMGKAMSSSFFLLVVFLAFADYSLTAEVYSVGNAVGWTILGNVNYTSWASSEKFHVGDTIVFVYNKQFHNVMEVNRADYRSCSTASPIATYATGNDSIVVKRRGHHFFICGAPGHCAAGQKVDIRIPKLKRSPPTARAVAPSSESPSPVPTNTTSSGPAPSGGSTREGFGVPLAVLAVAAAAVCYAL